MNKPESDKNKKCVTFDNFGILFAVIEVCGTAPVYTSLCRGLKYLLKIPYFIGYSNMTEFLIFETVFCVKIKMYLRYMYFINLYLYDYFGLSFWGVLCFRTAPSGDEFLVPKTDWHNHKRLYRFIFHFYTFAVIHNL